MKNTFGFKNEIERQTFVKGKEEALKTFPFITFAFLASALIFLCLITIIVGVVFKIEPIMNTSDNLFNYVMVSTFVIPPIVAIIQAFSISKTVKAAKAVQLNDSEYKETLLSNLNSAKELLAKIEEWEKELKDIKTNVNLLKMLNELDSSVDQLSKEGPVLLTLKSSFINYFEYVSKKLRLEEMEVRTIDRRILKLRIEVAIDEAEKTLAELK